MSAPPVPVPGIEREPLTAWLEAHVPGLRPPLDFELITGGHSNLTFLLRDAAGERCVLRRPPLGAVIATAHDMAREHRIISALAPTDVPVPPALALCEDPEVNGAPFYVMAFVEGQVLSEADVVEAHFDRDLRPQIAASLIDVLAALHRVDLDAVGLGDLGRREAYLARQLRRWQMQWEKTKTRELPLMDEVHDLLEKTAPEQIGATVVHGDYRLGNTLTARNGNVAAVLDWELCTLGDPLADVGYLLNGWAQPGEDDPSARRGAARAPTLAGGFPPREELMRRYAERTGRDLAQIDYYRAFQYWRFAAIVEGVMSRYMKGVMAGDADIDAFRTQIDAYAVAAREQLRQMGA